MSYSFSATRGISEVSPRPLRPGRRALRRVPWRLQTYRNILYLLASFPLGLCYFAFIVTGVCLALGLPVLWVGAPIFLVTMVALGLTRGPWVILGAPAAMLIGYAFGGLGMAATTWIRSFVHFDYINLAKMNCKPKIYRALFGNALVAQIKPPK